MLEGPAVKDVYQHFVERWNFIYTLKYRAKANTDGRYGLLGFPLPVGSGYPDQPDHPDHEPMTQHPYFEHWTRIGQRFLRMDNNREGSYPSRDVDRHREIPRRPGNMKVQVVRSCADWSNGTTTEVCICQPISSTGRVSNRVFRRVAFHYECLHQAYRRV